MSKIKNKNESESKVETMEDVVIRYSQKWGVSEQEAAQKILGFLENEGKHVNMPTAGNLFPAALGDLSKKVQDVNQAILSTHLTRRNIQEMNQPTEALKDLATVKERLNSLETTINTQLKNLQDTLDAKNQEEAQREILEKMQGVVNPLKEKIEALESVMKPPVPGGKVITNNTDLIKAYGEATDESQKFLKSQGFILGKVGSGGAGMSGENTINLYTKVLDRQDKIDDRAWEREKWKDDQVIKKLEITEREKTLRDIAKDGLKRVAPLLDAISDDVEGRIRNKESKPPLKQKMPDTANEFICPGCNAKIPITGQPEKIECDSCGKTYQRQAE